MISVNAVRKEIIIDASPGSRLFEAARRIRSAKWMKKANYWSIPLTEVACRELLRLAGPELAGNGIAETIIASHAAAINPASYDTPIPITKTTPWAHQVRGYNMIARHDATFLMWEMGAGKTKPVIDWINNQKVCRVLIVCPKSVLDVWEKEFTRHGIKTFWMIRLKNVPDFDKYMKGFLQCEETGICLCNYDMIWRGDIGKAVLAQHWDMVVCDESHRIKAPGSKVSRFFALLRSRAAKRVCLSGTPMYNGPLDLYGQYRFLDPACFGTSFNAFQERYAVMGGFENQMIFGYKREEEMHTRMMWIADHVAVDDVIELPDVVHETITVELDSKTRAIYKQMKKEMIHEFGDVSITAANAAVLLSKLQQIAAGFILPPQPESCTARPPAIPLHSAKLDALEELVDSFTGEPFVVFCKFREDIRAIAERLKTMKLKTCELSGNANEYAKWIGGKPDVIIVQVQAGALGIDLTRARRVIYYTHTFSLGDYTQSLARVRRPGQTRKVFYYHIVARTTVDGVIVKALADKENAVDRIMNAIREGEDE